ncbi:hypothetical protein U91I_01604 [alpha proteobacterium U9-1i]|nr:hypothetical protein U91I_01604 [alpha proteobacterium U9-1i]
MGMTQTPSYGSEPGRSAAFIAYVLYLLSIPSAGVFALVGVIVAYAGRGEAQGAARSHIDDQIRIWWVAFWWAVAIWIGYVVGTVLAVVLIGIPILMLAWLANLIVFIWFTVKSFFGLLALLDGRSR